MMKVECPRCHTHVEMPVDGDPVCPTCGFTGGGIAGAPTTPPGASAPSAEPVRPAADSGNSSAYGESPRTGMAVTALVLGIVGFLTGFLFFGIALDVAAIIIGAMALSKTKKEPGVYAGKGMAVAGIVIGSLGLLFMVIILAAAPALIGIAVEECERDPDQPNCDQILEEYGDRATASPGPLAWMGTVVQPRGTWTG